MNWSAVFAIMLKDISQVFRNRFLAFILILTISWFAAIYHLLPKKVDETIELGIYAHGIGQVSEDFAKATEISMLKFLSKKEALKEAAEKGIRLQLFSDEEELKKAVENNDLVMGFSFSQPALRAFTSTGNEPLRATVYFSNDTPSDMQQGLELFFEELTLQATGRKLPVALNVEILGQDMVGEQIPQRDRAIPLYLSFILMVEMMSLAVLILEEIEAGTIAALLVAPVSVKDLITAKGLVGIILAFSEAALLMALIGVIQAEIAIVLLALLLGAIMVTGIALFIGGIARDSITVFGWSLLIYVCLFVPAVAVFVPGAVSAWVKLIPSYYLVDILNQAVNYSARFAQIWASFGALLIFDLAVFWLGYLTLKRRYQ